MSLWNMLEALQDYKVTKATRLITYDKSQQERSSDKNGENMTNINFDYTLAFVY